jgi:hypothetical protein
MRMLRKKTASDGYSQGSLDGSGNRGAFCCGRGSEGPPTSVIGGKRTEQNPVERVIDLASLAVTISYDRSQRYMGGGYPTYTNVDSLDKNPLWNRLDKKASQVRAAGGARRLVMFMVGMFTASDAISRLLA